MSHDRHVMTLNAQVCRNTWITRVNIIVFWKKIVSEFELIRPSHSFLMTYILVIFAYATLTVLRCLQHTLIAYSTRWLFTAHSDCWLFTAHIDCLQETLIIYNTLWLLTAHIDYLQHTPWLLTAHTDCLQHNTWLLTAYTDRLHHTLIAYSTHWLLTAHTNCLQKTVIAYNTHWLLTTHPNCSQHTPLLLTAHLDCLQHTTWLVTAHMDCLQHTTWSLTANTDSLQEDFEFFCYLRNSSEIYRVNNEYLLCMIVNKFTVQLKKTSALVKKWRVLGKNKLVRTVLWCENAMCFKDVSIDDALSQILSRTQRGGYDFYNMTVVIRC